MSRQSSGDARPVRQTLKRSPSSKGNVTKPGDEDNVELDDTLDRPGVLPLPDYDLDTTALTPFERKSLLIDRELNSHGMGRYQWWIWTLCGLG